MRHIKIHMPETQFMHMNTRPEGAGEDFHPATDLKFEGHCNGEILKVLCGSDALPPFWNAEGSPIYPGIKSFDCSAELEGSELEFGDLEMSSIKLKGVKINKFRFTPISGYGVKLSLRAQLRPEDEALVKLAHAIKKKAVLNIDCMLGYAGDDASAHIKHAKQRAEDEQDLLSDQQSASNADDQAEDAADAEKEKKPRRRAAAKK